MPPHSSRPKNRRTLSIDLEQIRRQLRWQPSVAGSEVLGPLEGLYRAEDHRYRRVDDGTLLHVMDYETLLPYELKIERADMVCVQIMLAGTYMRRSAVRSQIVESSMTSISNLPESLSVTNAGQKLQGIWIACDRRHFLSRYGLQPDMVPTDYVPLFQSARGMPVAIELATQGPNIVAAQEILSCRMKEPLNSLYVAAKVTEILCNVVAQLHSMAGARGPGRIHTWEATQQAIGAAAEIYRRTLSSPPTVDELAQKVGLNRNMLTAGFKARFGATPNAFAHALRMREAKTLLDGGHLSISDIARSVG